MDHRTIVSFFTCQLVWVNRYTATASAQLAKYEASLRAQYGSLDALLVKMNNSASALSSLQTNYQKS